MCTAQSTRAQPLFVVDCCATPQAYEAYGRKNYSIVYPWLPVCLRLVEPSAKNVRCWQDARRATVASACFRHKSAPCSARWRVTPDHPIQGSDRYPNSISKSGLVSIRIDWRNLRCTSDWRQSRERTYPFLYMLHIMVCPIAGLLTGSHKITFSIEK